MRNAASVSSFLVIILAGALLAPNCATMTRRSRQSIPVMSTPVGATVIVDGVLQGETPRVLYLARKQKGQVIRIESPGYNPIEIRLKRRLSGGPILSNLLLGTVSGLGLTVIYWQLRLGHAPEEQIHHEDWVIWWISAAAIRAVFIGIDKNGDGYSLSPKDLTVTLTKADGTPRVDTMFVDAEDFQNVKWIRVRGD
jgi:hypothetical protein